MSRLKGKQCIAIIMTFILLLSCITKFKVNADSGVSVTYDSHIQNSGWLNNYVSDGSISGTTGQSLRLEAMIIKLRNATNGMTLKYQVHTQYLGWLPWVSEGEIAGTTGQSLRGEAIKIQLVNAPSNYHIYYQVHSQNLGWLPWVKDGEEAGTTGRSLRMEAIRIKIVKDGESIPSDYPSNDKFPALPSNDNIVKGGKKIGIDIGHNTPYDIGAKGFVQEDVVNMQVGLKVIEKLNNLGYNVVNCTPRTAYSLSNSLQQRVDKANSNKVDYYISIHHNKYDGNGNGTEVYSYDSSGKALAESIVNKISELGFRNRGSKTANFYVLKYTNMPAILIECCFIDSPIDMAKYNSEAIANKIVEGITRVIR